MFTNMSIVFEAVDIKSSSSLLTPSFAAKRGGVVDLDIVELIMASRTG